MVLVLDGSSVSQLFGTQTDRNIVYIRAFNYNYKTVQVLSTVSYNQICFMQTIVGNYSFAYYQLGDNPRKANTQPIAGTSYGPNAISGEQWI